MEWKWLLLSYKLYRWTWIWQTTVRRIFAYDGRYAWSQSDAYQVFIICIRRILHMTDQFSWSNWVCHIQVHLYYTGLESQRQITGILIRAITLISQLISRTWKMNRLKTNSLGILRTLNPLSRSYHLWTVDPDHRRHLQPAACWVTSLLNICELWTLTTGAIYNQLLTWWHQYLPFVNCGPWPPAPSTTSCLLGDITTYRLWTVDPDHRRHLQTAACLVTSLLTVCELWTLTTGAIYNKLLAGWHHYLPFVNCGPWPPAPSTTSCLLGDITICRAWLLTRDTSWITFPVWNTSWKTMEKTKI